jgi:hypothetical protein
MCIFCVGMLTKFYLDVLWRRHAVLRPRVAENACECKMPVESACPETNWSFSPLIKASPEPEPSALESTVEKLFDMIQDGIPRLSCR